MSNEQDFTKEQFVSLWTANGFVHTWDAYGKNYKEDIMNFVSSLISKDNSTTLEIGCGGGYWTAALYAMSKTMYAVDLLPRPNIPHDVNYIELGTNQYNVPQIADGTIDLIFSYGVFCHLSKKARTAYIKDIKRMMHPDGCAIIMFSDSDKLMAQTGMNPASIGFYHDTYKDTCTMLTKAGLKYSNVLGEDYPRVLLKITK